MLRLKYAPLVLAVLAVIGLPARMGGGSIPLLFRLWHERRPGALHQRAQCPRDLAPGRNWRCRLSTFRKAAADQFESNPILSIPGVFVDQWSPAQQIAPESLISERYLRSADDTARKITLKQAIYIAIRNNPALKASELDPIASTEGVREANAAFDPDLTSQLDILKNVAPTSSALQAPGSDAFTQKFYDWNFGLAKAARHAPMAPSA